MSVGDEEGIIDGVDEGEVGNKETVGEELEAIDGTSVGFIEGRDVGVEEEGVAVGLGAITLKAPITVPDIKVL